METFEQRLDEINYLTELLRVQTQSLLKDLLSKLNPNDLTGYVVNNIVSIETIQPGTLLFEACEPFGGGVWDDTFEDAPQEYQLDLIKHIIENKLHEKTDTSNN